MAYHTETHLLFQEINKFLNEKDINLHTLKGVIEGYKSPLDDDDKSRVEYWNNKILEFVNNPNREECDPRKLEQLRTDAMRKRFAEFTMVIEKVMECEHITLSGQKPYLFFEHSGMDMFEETFNNTIGHDFLEDWKEEQQWADNDSDLWNAIVKTVKKLVKIEECEIYSYDPPRDADPLVLSHEAMFTCYLFITDTKQHLVIAMQFSRIGILSMKRTREQRAREEAKKAAREAKKAAKEAKKAAKEAKAARGGR